MPEKSNVCLEKAHACDVAADEADPGSHEKHQHGGLPLEHVGQREVAEVDVRARHDVVEVGPIQLGCDAGLGAHDVAVGEDGAFVIIKVTLLINHYNKNKLANYF